MTFTPRRHDVREFGRLAQDFAKDANQLPVAQE